MTKAIALRISTGAALALALACSPVSAAVKPAKLDAAGYPLVLAQQQAEPADAEQQKPQKKQAKKKRMSREDEAKAKARKYLPPEYHQYIPR